MAYAYQVEDKSLTVPILKRYLWDPAMVLVPEHRSANTLTILGNIASLTAFLFLALARPVNAPAATFLCPAVLLWIFLALDNMDGAQARRTQTGSPYGEFLDHWGDTFNMGFVTLGYGIALALEPWMILASLALCQLTNFSQFWEQRHTGWLRFGRIGGTEGVLAVSLVYVAVSIFGWEAIAQAPVLGPATISHLIWAAACFGLLHAMACCLLRVRRQFAEFATLVLLVAAVAPWHLAWGLGILPASFILVFAGSLMTGRQIIHRILETTFQPFEWPLLGLAALGTLAGALGVREGAGQALLAWLPVAYLFLRLMGDFLKTSRQLSEHLRPDELLALCLAPTRHFRSSSRKRWTDHTFVA
jgi:phosphatidylglycerophosphate synthase